LSLREALRLGHNYIGTEHILLGVMRGADAEGSSVSEVLGVGAEEVRARVLETLANGPALLARQSPALVEAMQRARQGAGPGPTTTGQLLLSILADGGSQAAKALQGLDVSVEAVEARLAAIPIATTSDAPPRARSVHIRLGEVTTTIDDPDLAAALGDLTPEQIAKVLRNALADDPGRDASG
jgi:ATP-dependent Clp protease ATP-binding subunit ClpA